MQQGEQPVAPQPMSPPPSPRPAAPPPGRPGTVQAIAIITLVSGILNCILGVTLIIATFFIWTLPAAFSIVVGVMEIVYASKLLSDPVRVARPAKHIAVMEIVNIINGSATSLAAGIIALVLYNNADVQQFFRGQANPPPA